MEDSTADGRYSPDPLCLPVEEPQIKAARDTLRENKGAQWSAFFAAGIQVGGNVELRDNLVALLVEFDVPMATISDAFGLSGREVWAIADSDPIWVFSCLDCGKLLKVCDRRDLLRLRRALRAVSEARPGDPGDSSLLCDSCTNLRLHIRSDEYRLSRLARQARIAQLRKMPFAEYRVQPEWQTRRTATLARAGYRCQVCGEDDARLDVHHNTYDRYGDESAFDLVTLCGECHGQFHGIVEDAS
jgi:5-methylcytosine-specific restriction endonuclease McrA